MGINSNSSGGYASRQSGNPAGAYTICCWIRVNDHSGGTEFQGLFEGADTGSNWQIYAYRSATEVGWYMQNVSTSAQGQIFSDDSTDWHFIAFRWSGVSTDNIQVSYRRIDSPSLTHVDTGQDGFALTRVTALHSLIWTEQAHDVDASAMLVFDAYLSDTELQDQSESLSPVDATDLQDEYPFATAASAANSNGPDNVSLTIVGTLADAGDPDLGSGGGVTGTVAETTSAATDTIPGEVLVDGSAAESAAAATDSLAGDVLVDGTLAESSSAATDAAAGEVEASGAIVESSSAATDALTGTVLVQGAAAESASAATDSLTGSVAFDGSLTEQAQPATDALAGSVLVEGSATEQASAAADALAGSVLIEGLVQETSSQATDTILTGALPEIVGSLVESSTAASDALAGDVLVSGAVVEAVSQARDQVVGMLAVFVLPNNLIAAEPVERVLSAGTAERILAA